MLVGSQSHPDLEDGSVYSQLWPTRLDKIENLHVEVQVVGVGIRPSPTFRAVAHPSVIGLPRVQALFVPSSIAFPADSRLCGARGLASGLSG